MSIKNDIERVHEMFTTAFERKNAQACADLYTEDAWIFDSDNPHAHGREAIEKSLQKSFPTADQANPKISNIEYAGNNDLAYSIATYSRDFRYDDGMVMTVVGQRVSIYKRQPNGALKIHISVLITDPNDTRRRYEHRE